VFLGFRGGKGVTTAFGAFLAIAPAATSTALAIWIVVLALGKKVSVASLSAAIVYPLLLLFMREHLLTSELLLFLFSIITSLLVVFTHRANIARLMRGEEKNVRQK
jgi:glycerol-3-phosphate acyltransferase PlsY